MNRVSHQRLELLPVLVEQLELEARRDRIEVPWLGDRFEAAHDEPADLFLVVDEAVGIADHRKLRGDAIDLSGDEVEVLGRIQRYVDAGLLSKSA